MRCVVAALVVAAALWAGRARAAPEGEGALTLATRVERHAGRAAERETRGDRVGAQRELSRACALALFVSFDPKEPLCARARGSARALGRLDLEATVTAHEALFAAWILDWEGARQGALRALEEAKGGAPGDQPDGEAPRLAHLALGAVALYKGDFDEATARWRELLGLARRAVDHEHMAEALLWLCRVSAMTGRFATARGECTDALAEARAARDENQEAVVQWSVGYAESEAERHPEALAAFQRSMELAEKVGSYFLAVTMRINVAEELAAAGRVPEAERAFAPVVALQRAGKLPATWRYQVEWKLGDFALLRGDFRAAAEHFALGAESSLHIIAVRSLLGRGAALGRLGEREQARVAYEAAIARVEATRAQLTGEEQRAGYFELHARAYRELVALLWDTHGEEAADRALAVAEAGRARALLDAVHASRGIAGAAKPLAAVQLRELLAPGELLIVYVSDAEHLYAIAVARDGARLTRLDRVGRATDLAERVSFLQELVRDGHPPAAIAAASRELHDDVLAPLLRGGEATLIIAPDGPLHRLPFDVLQGEGGAVLDRFVVSVVPSGSIMGEGTSRRHAGTHPFLGIADPPAAGLGALHHARDEVRAGAEHLGEGSLVFVGDDASEVRIKRALDDPFRVLHFATHGVVDDAVPMRSALVLAPGSGEDGMLRAEEIYRLAPRAELVLLPSCRSGTGRAGGEGVMSLARAFLHAGAGAVLASLWDLDDRATAQLVSRFYGAIAEGRAVPEALAVAKRDLARRGAPPRVWAALVAFAPPRARIDGVRAPAHPAPSAASAFALVAVVLAIVWGVRAARARRA